MGSLELSACTYSVKVVYYIVIINFADRTTEDIYNGLDTKNARKIPFVVWRTAARNLDMINAAHDLRDLRVPPANRLEVLKGQWKEHYSIRINDQYRIVFKWVDGNAKDVLITDYH